MRDLITHNIVFSWMAEPTLAFLHTLEATAFYARRMLCDVAQGRLRLRLNWARNEGIAKRAGINQPGRRHTGNCHIESRESRLSFQGDAVAPNAVPVSAMQCEPVGQTYCPGSLRVFVVFASCSWRRWLFSSYSLGVVDCAT